MERSERAGRAPWITAGVAGVALAALILVYFAFLSPDKADATRAKPALGGFTADERAAVAAASDAVANLQTFSRAHFASDWARAEASTTGKLHSDVVSSRTAALKAITAGKFDTAGKVTHSALEGPSETKNGYIVLVSVNGYHTSTPTQTVPSNLAVEMVEVKGKWLADSVQSVGIAGS